MPRPILAWVLADQLVLDHPAIRRAEAEAGGREGVRVALVESRAWMTRLPYHRKRQTLILSAGRHFRAELEAEGYAVDLVAAEDSRAGLAKLIKKHEPAKLLTMAAAEHAPRRWQAGSMAEDLGIAAEVVPNAMFLVGRHDPIPSPEPGRKYVMETFYRAMRKEFGLLMEAGGKPTGGGWNFDAENRKPLPKGYRPPPLPRFEPDAITRKAMGEVEASGHGVGSAEGFDLPVTRADAQKAFDDFLDRRLPEFGRYEDAMSSREGVINHSLLSPQMNLGLLEPLAMARAAEAEYRAGRSPLNSVEGFIRQVVGWREFMYWQYHRQMPGLRRANSWGATRTLPSLYWDGETEMRCLASIVGRLVETGYTHHIERLMILCNFAMLAGVDPAALADWFLAMYVDSHDWVVLPNVIAMGLNADGGVTATKPYIASAAYINRMSDFCRGCAFDHAKKLGDGACPFNALYWNFLIEHEDAIRANRRIGPMAINLKRLGEDDRRAIRERAGAFLGSLPFDDPKPPRTSHPAAAAEEVG